MKTQIFINLEEKNTQKVEVKPAGKGYTHIYVYAKTWQQAQDLATEAIKDLKQEEEPAADQMQKHVTTCSPEERNELTKAYEESQEGQRFLRNIEKAKQFTKKHSKGGLSALQLDYLANKYDNALLNASYDLIALTYKRAYSDGKAAANQEGAKRT